MAIPDIVVGVEVRWYLGYANSPTLAVHLTENPPKITYDAYPQEEGVMDRQVVLVGRNAPWVRFVYIEDATYDSTRGGALGGLYKLNNGSEIRSKSGWSSNAGHFNKERKYYEKTLPEDIVEVSYYVPEWNCGMAGYSIDISVAREIMQKWLPDVYLVKDDRGYGIYWTPSILPGEVVKPPKGYNDIKVGGTSTRRKFHR